jgi:hypothetical protein
MHFSMKNTLKNNYTPKQANFFSNHLQELMATHTNTWATANNVIFFSIKKFHE